MQQYVCTYKLDTDATTSNSSILNHRDFLRIDVDEISKMSPHGATLRVVASQGMQSECDMDCADTMHSALQVKQLPILYRTSGSSTLRWIAIVESTVFSPGRLNGTEPYLRMISRTANASSSGHWPDDGGDGGGGR